MNSRLELPNEAKAEVEFQLAKTGKSTQRAMSPFVLSSGCVVGKQEITTIQRGHFPFARHKGIT
jgi:hypothetical protein